MVFRSRAQPSPNAGRIMCGEGIDWTTVTAFNGRIISASAHAPERFARGWTTILWRVSFPGCIISPEPDASAAAMRYADLLAAAPITLCAGDWCQWTHCLQ